MSWIMSHHEFFHCWGWQCRRHIWGTLMWQPCNGAVRCSGSLKWPPADCLVAKWSFSSWNTGVLGVDYAAFLETFLCHESWVIMSFFTAEDDNAAGTYEGISWGSHAMGQWDAAAALSGSSWLPGGKMIFLQLKHRCVRSWLCCVSWNILMSWIMSHHEFFHCWGWQCQCQVCQVRPFRFATPSVISCGWCRFFLSKGSFYGIITWSNKSYEYLYGYKIWYDIILPHILIIPPFSW